KKSTLAYANEHRPWQLYQQVFEQTLFKCQELVASQGGRKKFRFKNKLMSLDGSIIDLSVSMFDWAKFRRTKGAIKLHLLLDHDGYLPSFGVVTEGKTSEIKVARTLRFAPGTILAIDRGYIDYEWFRELTQEEVYFVTRMKEKAVYEIKEELEVPQNRNVVRDQIICFPRLAREGEERCYSGGWRFGTRRKRRPSCSFRTCWPSARRPSRPFTKTVGKWNCFLRRSNRTCA